MTRSKATSGPLRAGRRSSALRQLAASMKGLETVLEAGFGLELIGAVRDELRLSDRLADHRVPRRDRVYVRHRSRCFLVAAASAKRSIVCSRVRALGEAAPS